MHKTILGVAALSLVAAPLHGQRQFRIGPTYSSISLQDLSGKSHAFSSFGGSAALITGDDGETGITVARYNNLSTDGAVRRLTLFALDSYYYPIGTRGVAPYAATELGLARDRKSTRLNSSHGYISYAVFCLKKKNKKRSELSEQTAPSVDSD